MQCCLGGCHARALDTVLRRLSPAIADKARALPVEQEMLAAADIIHFQRIDHDAFRRREKQFGPHRVAAGDQIEELLEIVRLIVDVVADSEGRSL